MPLYFVQMTNAFCPIEALVVGPGEACSRISPSASNVF